MSQPLWRAMNLAQIALCYPLPQEMEYADAIAAMHAIRAAELRAVADAIDMEWLDNSLTEIGTVGMISDWLRAEADRAEAGE